MRKIYEHIINEKELQIDNHIYINMKKYNEQIREY